MLDHLISYKTASTLGSMALSTGLLPLGGLTWMAPAAPGLVANLAANSESAQSGMIGHYAWPILPWLFLSAAAGALWLHRRWPKVAAIWMGLLLAATVADNPAVRRGFTVSNPAEAAIVREQLRRVAGTSILAQANLIPHLPKTERLYSIGSLLVPAADPELVLLTPIGNLWPLTPKEVFDLIERYRQDARYVEIVSGPLFAFKIKR
jgi:uncharacterized membrane protein